MMFVCEICNFKFSRKDKLLQHNKFAHGPAVAHQCPICETNVVRLKRHIEDVHERKNTFWSNS